MKITILGGASFSTPALFQGMRGEFATSEFILVGRSEEHLHNVSRASKLVAGDQSPTITPLVCDPQTSAAALKGAAVVLIQMRIGNMPGRGFDESFPLPFGLCGDEGLGPGGVSAAWRSWPLIEPWLQAIRQHAPRALVLMMTSPVGILTRAAHIRFPDLHCLGICEVPYVALREISARLATDFNSIGFEYLGVNHIGWLYGIRSNDRDLVKEWAELSARTGFPSRDIIMEWGGIPTKYLRLHFEADAVLTSQRSVKVPRAVELQRIQSDALTKYATVSEPQLREMLRRRETPWYSDAIIPLLHGMINGESPGPFFLSGPNRGYAAACEADDILEISCRVENGAIIRIPSSTAPPEPIAKLVRQFCTHERVATDAVLQRDSSLLKAALRVHPWVARASGSVDRLPSLLAEEITAGNALLATSVF